jgi:hypothetical protein
MKTERSVRIKVLSRDGRELFKGGIEVPEDVRFLSAYLNHFHISNTLYPLFLFPKTSTI